MSEISLYSVSQLINTTKTDLDTKINNKVDKNDLADPSKPGLMSKEDKAKLNTMTAGAAPYVHPSAHPATMITEDTSHRFVTDAQITTWNNGIVSAQVMRSDVDTVNNNKVTVGTLSVQSKFEVKFNSTENSLDFIFVG